jgi:hypothetical protein
VILEFRVFILFFKYSEWSSLKNGGDCCVEFMRCINIRDAYIRFMYTLILYVFLVSTIVY